MKRINIGLLGCLVLALLVVSAHAEETTPVAWGGVGSTFGPCGLGVPAGLLAVGGNVVFAKSNGVWESDSRVNGKVKTTKLNEIFKTRYGLMKGLDIRTATPIYNVHMDKTNAANRDVYGIGDTCVLLHKTLLSQKAGAPLSVGMDFGGIVPTASVSEHSSDFVGNDAWGVMGGLGGTYFLGANRFDSEVNYATFTEGAHDYRKGNRLRWNLGYAYALSDLWDLGAESSWEMSDESAIEGVGQRDAYVEWYAGPKVVFKYKPWNLNAGLVAKVPVHRWYESNKVGSDDFRLECKIIKAFNLNALFD
ncbi:transporter [Pseudodesulfovibrio karagichevae]|uniref:Transporter n=1 Tax=Pseudodesulfovibrio karagichevae TaxID=3239305 RepID=A0ABV4K026_9BACT